MDSAVEELFVLNDEDRLESVQAGRVYHIGLILHINEKASGMKAVGCRDERFRIVASREGIVRIERVRS